MRSCARDVGSCARDVGSFSCIWTYVSCTWTYVSCTWTHCASPLWCEDLNSSLISFPHDGIYGSPAPQAGRQLGWRSPTARRPSTPHCPHWPPARDDRLHASTISAAINTRPRYHLQFCTSYLLTCDVFNWKHFQIQRSSFLISFLMSLKI